MERYYYDCQTFLADVDRLTQQIDWEFDAIIAIARGGMSLAQRLGEHYNLRSVYTINTIGYDDTEKRESVEVFNIPDLRDARRVLVVDDIVDSGDTLREVLSVLQRTYPHATYKTASLFYKKSARVTPDWSVKEADTWIDFFWSVPTKAL